MIRAFPRVFAIIICIGVLVGPVGADVYVWKDPATGKTRMTNIPPPWVREPPPGRRLPRVEVIRGTSVIDPKTALANPQPLVNAPAGAQAAPQPAPPTGPQGQPGVRQPGVDDPND